MARLSRGVEPQKGLDSYARQSFHSLVQFLFQATAEDVVLSEIRDLLQDVRLLDSRRILLWACS